MEVEREMRGCGGGPPATIGSAILAIEEFA